MAIKPRDRDVIHRNTKPTAQTAPTDRDPKRSIHDGAQGFASPPRHVHRQQPRAGTGRGRPRRRGPGAGAVRGGVLLERGAGVPAPLRRGAHGGGLLAGPPPRAHLHRRLRRRHGARRGGAPALRPQGVPLRAPPRRLLGKAQPNHAQQTGQRHRNAVQVGHLLLHAGAGEAGARVHGRQAEGVEGDHRDRDPAGDKVLPGGGVPPAVPREGRPVRKEEMQRPHPLLRLRKHLHRPSRQPRE